jgi:2-hydroxy-3-keto-5-methylthiopentenyl-1-phosphate phosphatase
MDFASDLSDCMLTFSTTDLVKYCEREKVPYRVFNDFGDIHEVVKKVVNGEITVQEAAVNQAAIEQS